MSELASGYRTLESSGTPTEEAGMEEDIEEQVDRVIRRAASGNR